MHEVEDVALGRALRVPPAAAIMVDDQYLALLAAIFERTARAFFAVQTPRRRPPLEQRGTVHPSAELLELRILGLHLMVLLAGRSRGWRVRHLLHFALRRTGDREAGGGARAPKAAAQAASLAAPPGASGSGTPLPFPSSSPCCPGFFCERRGQSSVTGRAGRVPRDPRTTIQGCPGLDARRGYPVKAEARVKPSVGAGRRPLFRSKASFPGAELPGPSRAHFMGL